LTSRRRADESICVSCLKRKELHGEVSEKLCPACAEIKSSSEFHKNSLSPDGLSGNCKKCANAKSKTWREENHDRFLYYLRIWQKENRDQLVKGCRQYYQDNIEHCKAVSRKWAKEHPQEVRVMQQRRRSREMNAEIVDLTAEQWMEILESYEYRCAYCGEIKKLTQDHVIPASRGGNYTKSNIVCACRSCNSSKNDKTVEEWIKAGGLPLREPTNVPGGA
jgi:5-methylcytosine-specific restriction endonuclease McrA